MPCLATCAEGRATALAESVRSEGLRRMFEVQVERSASWTSLRRRAPWGLARSSRAP